MTGRWSTQVEQWGWQRRAVAELAVVMTAHRDLPAIAWTVAPVGCTLTGHVNALVPAEQVRATFASWREALGLQEKVRQHVGSGGTVYLQAVADRGQVRVRLTATVFDDEPVQP